MITGLALGLVLGPFASALLLTIRWAGRTLLHHVRPRRTAKP
ncbi:hypothetical protein [Streptomyces longhuiensis]|nr:hypothetical protein [Streptomyces longhuiensis]